MKTVEEPITKREMAEAIADDFRSVLASSDADDLVDCVMNALAAMEIQTIKRCADIVEQAALTHLSTLEAADDLRSLLPTQDS